MPVLEDWFGSLVVDLIELLCLNKACKKAISTVFAKQ